MFGGWWTCGGPSRALITQGRGIRPVLAHSTRAERLARPTANCVTCHLMPRSSIERPFLLCAAVIFCATGILKLFSILQDLQVLARPDPLLLFLTQRQTLFCAGVIELYVARRILFSKAASSRSQVAAVAWLSSLLACYRFGLWFTGYRGECNCLGHVGDWLHLSHTAMAVLLWSIIGCLILTSCTILGYSVVLDRRCRREVTAVHDHCDLV